MWLALFLGSLQLSKKKPKNSTKNLSAALQAVTDPLDNQLGYMGWQETLQA